MTNHSTFSITATPDTWPGVIRQMSKNMDVKTTGAFRHSFEALEAIVNDTVQKMNQARAEMFLEVAAIHAAQPGAGIVSDFRARRGQLIAGLHLMDKKGLAYFVGDMSETEFVVMVELARWRRAFGDREYGVTDPLGDEFEAKKRA
jgi:hypothetical protein